MSGQLLLSLAAGASGGVLLLGLLSTGSARTGLAASARTPIMHAERALTLLALTFVAGATLYLALSLAGGDYAIRYVWQHTASYQPLGQRLSALLAAQEGTLLLWSLVTVAFTLVALEATRRGDPRDTPTHRSAYRIMTALGLALLLLTLLSQPFQSFADAFPSVSAGAVPVEGRGLNPVLQNPWMPLHTGLTFLGYGLLALGFALALGQLLSVARGDASALERGRAALRRVALWAWLVLSLSLLSGLVWAFEEMTFGWFWSWDPVEAATLVVWLVLTAALHAPGGGVLAGPRDGSSPRVGPARALSAPVLIATALLAVVFASFVTRSGLHPSSVHAFAGGSTGVYLGALLALLLTALASVTLAARRSLANPSPSPASIEPATPTTSRPPAPASWSAVTLLSTLALLIVWGLLYPVLASWQSGRAVELEASYFNLWASLLALALLLAMGFTMRGTRLRGDRRTLLSVLALTIAAGFVAPDEALRLLGPEQRLGLAPIVELWGRASVLALLPPAGYALVAVFDRWWCTLRASPPAGTPPATRNARLRESGLALLHSGFVLAIVALTLSTALSTTTTLRVVPGAELPSWQGAVGARALTLERSELVDARGVVVEQRESLGVEVYVGDTLVSAGTAHLHTYPERGNGRHARVWLDRGLWFDTQVIYHGLAEADPAGVPLTVRRIPLASAVWLGLLLLSCGAGLSLVSRLGARPVPRQPVTATAVDPASAEIAMGARR